MVHDKSEKVNLRFNGKESSYASYKSSLYSMIKAYDAKRSKLIAHKEDRFLKQMSLDLLMEKTKCPEKGDTPKTSFDLSN